MNAEHTQPIVLPARIEFSGTWHCNLCEGSGSGSFPGYNEHYAGYHR